MTKAIGLSPVIAGTMKWGLWGSKYTGSQYADMIDRCLSMGVSSFDHADIYGHYTTEEEFGKALKGQSRLRNQIQLISKCGIQIVSPQRPSHKIKYYNTSRKHILESAERSLQNLHTDYLDLLLVHRPDPLMDPDEIAEAFHLLQKQGKVLHFGVSNFSPSQVEVIYSRFPIICNQVEISILRLEPFLDGTLDQCLTHKLIPMAWSPLGGGNIFARLEDDRNLRVVAVAQMLGDKYQTGADQVLLAWLLKHPAGIIPVLGTSKPERIEAAMHASHIQMEREEWFMLWRASTGEEVP